MIYTCTCIPENKKWWPVRQHYSWFTFYMCKIWLISGCLMTNQMWRTQKSSGWSLWKLARSWGATLSRRQAQTSWSGKNISDVYLASWPEASGINSLSFHISHWKLSCLHCNIFHTYITCTHVFCYFRIGRDVFGTIDGADFSHIDRRTKRLLFNAKIVISTKVIG